MIPTQRDSSEYIKIRQNKYSNELFAYTRTTCRNLFYFDKKYMLIIFKVLQRWWLRYNQFTSKDHVLLSSGGIMQNKIK